MDLRPFCVGLRKRMHALRTLGCLLFSSIWLAACGDGETAPVKPDETEQPSERQDVPEVTEIPETCNGYEELCERRFDEVTFPGTHNSMSVAEEKWAAPNQQYSIERQLEDGIRVMMLDVYFQENELKLCHSICLFGERPLDDALFAIRDFLRSERGEILTLILQDETEADRIVEAFEARGLHEWAYVYEGGEWPTLREMIDSNKRLIVTAERSGDGDGTPDWYHYAWSLMLDNPYTYETAEDFSCVANRGSTDNPLYLVNHWLQKPISSPQLAAVANEHETLLGHAQTCEVEQERRVNFLAVDHYNVGDLFDVVRVLNGLE